jgi:hypothetical protein
MTVSCEWMVADPLDSADCPTFARGSACAVRRRLRPPHAAAAAAAAAAWMRCSAGFGLGPDFGSEVKLEALRPALVQTSVCCWPSFGGSFCDRTGFRFCC